MWPLILGSLLVSSTLAVPHQNFARQNPENPDDPQASDPQTPPTQFIEPPRPLNPFANGLQNAPPSCTDFQKPSDQCLNDLIAQPQGGAIAFSGGELKWDDDNKCDDPQKAKLLTAFYDAHTLATFAHELPIERGAKSIALWKTWMGPDYATQQQRIYDNFGRASDMFSKKTFDILVSCNDRKGWCDIQRDGKGVGGYGWTYKGWFGYYHYVTMCPIFFTMDTMEERITAIEADLARGENKSATSADWQKHTGQAFLHEMMHLDAVGKPHINDEHIDPTGVGPWAYGPRRTYQLAQRRLNQGGGAGRASTNADSYAWFANSKYFWDLTGYFPAPSNYRNQAAIDQIDSSDEQIIWTMSLGTIDANTSEDDIQARANANGAVAGAPCTGNPLSCSNNAPPPAECTGNPLSCSNNAPPAS